VVRELIHDHVLENEMNIGGLLQLGSTIFCKVPLTEAELEIYRVSPETAQSKLPRATAPAGFSGSLTGRWRECAP
jgi:hypothetical protein